MYCTCGHVEGFMIQLSDWTELFSPLHFRVRRLKDFFNGTNLVAAREDKNCRNF